MQQSYRFVVRGRVQGVGFREATRRKALSLGVAGWVRNRADGCVEGLVSGDSASRLENFREWLTLGPPSAQVSGVDWTPDQEPFADTLFQIER